MHTIIKIAVVSVLSLFAVVGVVSISKAELLICLTPFQEKLDFTIYKRSGIFPRENKMTGVWKLELVN